MQEYVAQVKQTLVELALIKRERALDAMPDSFHQVFLLLPALLHYHHPNLPGYMPEPVPNGISFYQPDKLIIDKLYSQFAFEDSALTQPTIKISALYSMGSTCSLGQSIDSDLDVWVCIEQNLHADERAALQQKCTLIEQWASSLGVQLTLFVVNVDRFRDKHHECLMGENCGSAQHMLLLEEFYRSANLLAGKLLLWYVIPDNFVINGQQYDSYDECILALIVSNAINREDWIDFGSLVDLSAEEYFGASLWQLYKSIDSPFKAVLKTLLLEAYSWQYPENKLIACEVKQAIQQNNMQYFCLDSYYMMLKRVTDYLHAVNDQQRLNLARSCFYLKVNEKLSFQDTNTSWRQLLLRKLVNDWGWQHEEIANLDGCDGWKIEQARQIHEVLLQTMMTGYRHLLSFGRRNNVESLISPKDLAILTRKLYAVYEVLPGKVTIINSNISNDLSEPYLTFIHVKNDRVNRPGWYVYKQKPTFESIISHQYLEYSHSLVKLVAWCYFNRLISDKTQFFYRDGDNHNPTKLNQLVADLQSYFTIDVPSASEEALYGPCEIRHLAIMINLKEDLTIDEQQVSFEDDLSRGNVLNFGEKELSLIQSINLLYRNSWNEIRVLHFSGSLCVLDAIKTLLNRMHKDADLPNAIKIFCYSQYLAKEIKEQIEQLIERCIDLRLSTTKNNSEQFLPLRINGSSWYLFFERFGVSVHQFDNSIDFYGAVSNNKVQGRALNIQDESNELPNEIDSVACEGIIQFFFEDTQEGFDLYILNENNQVEIYRNCNGNKQNMVRDVNSFYALSDDRFTFVASSSVNFNLPQFYQILHDSDGSKKIVLFNGIE